MKKIEHVVTHEFDRAYMVPVPTSILDSVEGALIRALNPKLNSSKREIAIGLGDFSQDELFLKKYADKLNTN